MKCNEEKDWGKPRPPTKQHIQYLSHRSCNTLIIANSDAEGIVEEIIAKNFEKLKTDTSNKSKRILRRINTTK